MLELFAIARQRYLDAGGHPLRSSNEKYITESEQQEFLELGGQFFADFVDQQLYTEEASQESKSIPK